LHGNSRPLTRPAPSSWEGRYQSFGMPISTWRMSITLSTPIGRSMAHPVRSLDEFNFARPPALVEERLERTVEAQDREPAFAGGRLDPVAPLDAGRQRRAEVDRRRAVRVRLGRRGRIRLAAGARVALPGVEHRARLVVVDRERPERPRGNVR